MLVCAHFLLPDSSHALVKGEQKLAVRDTMYRMQQNKNRLKFFADVFNKIEIASKQCLSFGNHFVC